MAGSEIGPPSNQPEAQSNAPGYDEFGTAKRNLPPAAPVAIALVIVGIVIAIIAYNQRAKPAATGSVDGVWFSQPQNIPSPMVLVEVTIRNVSD